MCTKTIFPLRKAVWITGRNSSQTQLYPGDLSPTVTGKDNKTPEQLHIGTKHQQECPVRRLHEVLRNPFSKTSSEHACQGQLDSLPTPNRGKINRNYSTTIPHDPSSYVCTQRSHPPPHIGASIASPIAYAALIWKPRSLPWACSWAFS